MAQGATGIVTIVEENFDNTKLISWAWSGGTAETALASATTTAYYTGKLLFCVTVPGNGAPADNYNVTILDKNDVDVLADGGLARSTNTTESILDASLGAVAHSQLELVVKDSGSAGTETGTVYLWIR